MKFIFLFRAIKPIVLLFLFSVASCNLSAYLAMNHLYVPQNACFGVDYREKEEVYRVLCVDSKVSSVLLFSSYRLQKLGNPRLNLEGKVENRTTLNIIYLQLHNYSSSEILKCNACNNNLVSFDNYLS